jgi:hypothetical protein
MPTDSEILAGLRNELDVMHSICIKDRDNRDDILATLRKYAAIARAVESEEWKLFPRDHEGAIRQAMYMAAHFDMGIENPDEWRAVDQSYRAAWDAAPQFQEEWK